MYGETISKLRERKLKDFYNFVTHSFPGRRQHTMQGHSGKHKGWSGGRRRKGNCRQVTLPWLPSEGLGRRDEQV